MEQWSLSLWSGGVWWHGNCHRSNLNRKYLGEKVDVRSVTWLHFKNKFLSLSNGPDKDDSNNGNEHVGMQERC